MARKQDRVFLLYDSGHWSGSSAGAGSVGSVSQLSRLTVALFWHSCFMVIWWWKKDWNTFRSILPVSTCSQQATAEEWTGTASLPKQYLSFDFFCRADKLYSWSAAGPSFKNVGSLFNGPVILCNRFLAGNLVLVLPLGRGGWLLEYENTLETVQSAINSPLIIII